MVLRTLKVPLVLRVPMALKVLRVLKVLNNPLIFRECWSRNGLVRQT